MSILFLFKKHWEMFPSLMPMTPELCCLIIIFIKHLHEERERHGREISLELWIRALRLKFDTDLRLGSHSYLALICFIFNLNTVIGEVNYLHRLFLNQNFLVTTTKTKSVMIVTLMRKAHQARTWFVENCSLLYGHFGHTVDIKTHFFNKLLVS